MLHMTVFTKGVSNFWSTTGTSHENVSVTVSEAMSLVKEKLAREPLLLYI